MKEIHDNIFIGPQKDYERLIAGQADWYVLHATKEPYHRAAVQYEGADPNPNHPEYLVARRGKRMMLNLIDAPVEVDIPKTIFDRALGFVSEGLANHHKVLIHCTEGVSRSATIGLLYLKMHTQKIIATSVEDALKEYDKIYPPFNPGKAMVYFLKQHWEEYSAAQTNSPSN